MTFIACIFFATAAAGAGGNSTHASGVLMHQAGILGLGVAPDHNRPIWHSPRTVGSGWDVVSTGRIRW